MHVIIFLIFVIEICTVMVSNVRNNFKWLLSLKTPDSRHFLHNICCAYDGCFFATLLYCMQFWGYQLISGDSVLLLGCDENKDEDISLMSIMPNFVIFALKIYLD